MEVEDEEDERVRVGVGVSRDVEEDEEEWTDLRWGRRKWRSRRREGIVEEENGKDEEVGMGVSSCGEARTGRTGGGVGG